MLRKSASQRTVRETRQTNQKLSRQIENVFSYRLQDAFQRGLGYDSTSSPSNTTEWPGELNRLSADGSILLKNGGAGGYGSGFLHHQTSSPAFQNHHQQQQQQLSTHNLASAVGQHPSQLHVQSSASQSQQTAALMMNGKSPSRDLGGGSTPVLKMTAAHNNNNNNTATTQAFRNNSTRLDCGAGSSSHNNISGGGGGGAIMGSGGVPSIMSASAAVRSVSRERLVQSQIVCLATSNSNNSSNSSRDLMARDARDAWDYYGPPPTTAQQQTNNNMATTGLSGSSSPSVVGSSPKILSAMANNGASPAGYATRPAVAPGGPASIISRQTQQSPAVGCNSQQQQQVFQQPRASVNNSIAGSASIVGGLRDPRDRYSLLSSSATSPSSPKVLDNGNNSLIHAPSPQRLYSPVGQCHPGQQQQQQQQRNQTMGGQQHQQQLLHHQQQQQQQHSSQQLQPTSSMVPQAQQQQQHQQQQSQSQQQAQQPCQQPQMIHHLQYPYYNAKLESLTHRMPNLSFEGLGQQQPTAATGAAVVSSRVTEQQQPLVSPAAAVTSSPSFSSTTSSSSSSSSSTSSSSCIPSSTPAGSSAGAAAAGSQPSASCGSTGPDSTSSKHEPSLLFLSAGHSESTAASDQSVNARATTSPLLLPSALLQVGSPSTSPGHQQTSSSAEVNGVGNTETSASTSTCSSTSSSSDNNVDVVNNKQQQQQFDSLSMDETISTATVSKASVRTSSPSVVVKTTTTISGRQNNKDLLSAEASGYLFRLADPSMMLVRPDSSPLSPSATSSTADQEESGGGSNSSTSSRLMASGVSNVSELLGAGMSPESVTDCGSLSKSSSDGDPVGVVSRKRPPTKLKSRRRNILSFPHHISVDELRLLQRRKESMYGGSSSDENRSSGHASMSDGHTSSSPPAETLPRHTHYRTCLNAVPEDDKMSANCVTPQQSHPPKTNNNRRVVTGKAVSRHRGLAGVKDDLSSQLEHATGLEDIKMAIEQLTLRSHGSRTSYSTSTYSSLSGSEGGAEPMRRLIRHSSLETINTNVTVADEFVWVDSYNRLVELQQLPWSNHDVLRVIQNGRIKEHLERVSMETVPRLSYLLQRALVRIARETQRLARPLAMCSKQEVCSALRIVLSPALADSCIKACLRAAAMFTVSGDMVRQSKSARAALQLSVGRFHRWMCDVRLGKFIHDYAAVYLAAGLENLLEEIMMQCMPSDQETLLTASVLENAIANNGDLWGLLQPYAHLNAGRTATGALSLPRWPSQSGLDSGLRGSGSSVSSNGDDHSRSAKTLEQSLLTTCVGTINELHELLQRVTQFHFRHSAPCPGATPNGGAKQALTWASSALHALFYFMRCSQLEHAEHAQRAPIQELVYERPYIVLPPLIEWVRVASAHSEHRHSSVLDKDDVAQAARLLLPGVDCPIRAYGFEEILCPRRHMDDLECSRKLKIDLAFKMLSSARSDLIPHALQLLPSTKINTVSENGLTPLMLAAIRGDETLAKVLLDAGADVDAETPTIAGAQTHPGAYPNPETQHWTALTYTAIQGQLNIAKLLLERGANVEGGARLSEDKCTETPLQVAVGSGNLDMISLLLSHGARPFLSTLVRDTLCYSSSAQKGCYSAIAVAAAHGQRAVLHKLLSHPVNGNSNAEVLSLEEILAEGASHLTSDRRPARSQASGSSSSSDSSRSGNNNGSDNKLQVVKLNKGQIKALQEAMYHSAENAHLDITLDLRNLGVPWTLHCWMHTLATAHEHSLENVIDQLLQDFLQVWGPDDYSTQFVDECLPIIFNIFRYSKNEGTTLLLADIFATCYGRENIKEIRDTSLCGGPRIDPKFVNNPELSDVQFRVEGRVFYAHKLILITASPRFKSMLNSKFCEGNPPIIQINDIRYDIFQMVMHYLYKGGCENLDVNQNDVLELMAAANFFQLDGLLRFCESRCSTLVDLDNIVSMYIHAKVYNAVQLLEYCQGFLLQNMVALLTYDDSVRRLIFGKKLHNHDVLAGLLLTLQARIKSRSQHKNK